MVIGHPVLDSKGKLPGKIHLTECGSCGPLVGNWTNVILTDAHRPSGEIATRTSVLSGEISVIVCAVYYLILILAPWWHGVLATTAVLWLLNNNLVNY